MFTEEKLKNSVEHIEAVIKTVKTMYSYNYCLGYIDALRECGALRGGELSRLLRLLDNQKIDWQ